VSSKHLLHCAALALVLVFCDLRPGPRSRFCRFWSGDAAAARYFMRDLSWRWSGRSGAGVWLWALWRCGCCGDRLAGSWRFEHATQVNDMVGVSLLERSLSLWLLNFGW